MTNVGHELLGTVCRKKKRNFLSRYMHTAISITLATILTKHNCAQAEAQGVHPTTAVCNFDLPETDAEHNHSCLAMAAWLHIADTQVDLMGCRFQLWSVLWWYMAKSS